MAEISACSFFIYCRYGALVWSRPNHVYPSPKPREGVSDGPPFPPKNQYRPFSSLSSSPDFPHLRPVAIETGISLLSLPLGRHRAPRRGNTREPIRTHGLHTEKGSKLSAMSKRPRDKRPSGFGERDRARLTLCPQAQQRIHISW